MLVLDSVCKRFGSTVAADAVSFTVTNGEFVTLLGPSGCGKTTTLRMIAGFIPPDAGAIRIGDTLVSDPARGILVPPERRRLGMVFQSYAVWPHMTVFENVAYPLRARRIARQEIARRVRETLDLVHMGELEARVPSQLSGGQQQRVALARALIDHPKVLLLDEPLSNLDAKLRESMRIEIKRLQRLSGITIVLVTHDQIEAMVMSDRIAVMHRGRVLQVGTPEDVYARPADRFVAGFLGKANFVPVIIDGEEVRIALPSVQIPAPLHPSDRAAMLERTSAALRSRTEATLVVRTEDVLVDDHRGTLPVTVRERFYVGDTVLLFVDAEGLSLQITAPKHVDASPGRELRIAFADGTLMPRSDSTDRDAGAARSE